MTSAARVEKRCAAFLAAVALFAPTSALADTNWGESLTFEGAIRPTLFDTDFPGHPRALARGHAGAITTATLDWTFDRRVSVQAGVLGRLPFAVDLEGEVGAFPLLAVTVTPFGDDLILRFGSLDIEHGFHPAVVDEPRYRYARNYEELYNRSIAPEAQRDLGGDPFLPIENGAQLIANLQPLRAEVFLDWQLLETDVNREKFAVGVLGDYDGRWFAAGFQYRLVHYGGQLFTQRETFRSMGLDKKRQPTTLALFAKAKPLAFLEFVKVELPFTFIQGRVVQTPEAAEETHRGFEVGADATFFDALTLGYRLWLPEDGAAKYVSEDGDAIYAGPRSHRARIALASTYGIVEIQGLLDLVFAEDASKVWYRTVTTVALKFDAVLWIAARAP